MSKGGKLMNDIPVPIPARPTRFMDLLRACIRSRNLAYSTEKIYCYWMKEFILFHGKAHPSTLNTEHVNQFLSALSIVKRVTINTQKTALNAIVFAYKYLLNTDLGQLNFSYSSRPRTLPTVFSHEEAISVINNLSGVTRLCAKLMYGAGLRVMETVRLRIQDIDFANSCIVVRETKGNKW